MSLIELRPADEVRYDVVSLGEVMLRLDPGEDASGPPASSARRKAAASTTWLVACARRLRSDLQS